MTGSRAYRETLRRRADTGAVLDIGGRLAVLGRFDTAPPRRENWATPITTRTRPFLLQVCRAVAAACVLACTTAALAQPAYPPVRYGGDSDFAPYEYLDAAGQPQGFNVALLRELSRRSGVPVEIHLGRWEERMRAFDAGELDMMTLAYSEARAAKYTLLSQVWTLYQSVLFQSGRPSYPGRLDDLAVESVAVESGSLVHELLDALPEPRRPTLVVVSNHREAVAELAAGRVTAAAGNGLALRAGAAQIGSEDLHEVPVKSLAYRFAARSPASPGVLALDAAFAPLRASGEVDRLVERYLTVPSGGPISRRFMRLVAFGALATALLLAGVLVWNGTLRRRVARHTAELRKTVGDLRESIDEREKTQAWVNALLQHMQGGLLVADEDGIIADLNPAAERIFGYTKEELRGRHLSLLLPPNLRPIADSFLGEARRKAIGRVTEWEGCRKNGSVFPFELAFWEFDTASGRYLAGNIRDISERREIDRLKSEFVSIVSHELRTPLTSVKGSLELLADEKAAGEQSEEDLLGIALANVNRLVRIVNDILDMSKIESGKILLERTPADPVRLARQAVQSVEPIARQYDVAIEIATTDPPPSVSVDGDRIVQALVNLLSNALKFAPERSVVTVRVDGRQEGRVVLSVTDRGRGIPDTLIGQLFQKFQQLPGAQERPAPGTGLGLAITKALVEQHGGTVTVESAVGEGSTFSISLPLDR